MASDAESRDLRAGDDGHGTDRDPDARERRQPGDTHEAEREGRRLAFSAIFEADFGQRTAARALDRQLELGAPSAAAVAHARLLVDAVMRHRDTIDARIERVAPAYPVVALARIDRALLRSALGELLHCAATPPRVAISEWVELARTYSGEPARRLLNGVLGRVAEEVTDAGPQATKQPRPAGGRTPPIKEDPE